MLEQIRSNEGRVLWVRVVTGLAIVLVLAVASTTLRYALRAGFDLAALGILAVLAWVAFHSLPMAGRYIEKRLLRARLTGARSHPIEQLTQKHLERRDHMRRDREALVVVAGQLIGMRELVARQRANAPHSDLSKQTAALELMTGCHARLASRLRANELALTQERALLDEQRFKWDFSQAGKRVTRGLWDQDREQIVASLAEDEALRAVEANFAEVMAALEAESLPVQLPGPITRSLKGGPA